MSFKKFVKKAVKHTVAPVFSLPAKAIQKVTGLDASAQLGIGAGIGSAAGLYGKLRGLPGGPPVSASAAAVPGSAANGASGFNFSRAAGSLLPSAIGVAGDIYSARTVASGQEAANEASLQSAREQMEFQERMSNTAHQREVADLRAAGLNPVLSANAGASTPVGASTDFDNAAPDYSRVGSNAVSTALQVAQMKKNFEEADSRIAANISQAGKTGAETRLMDADFPQKKQGREWLKYFMDYLESSSKSLKDSYEYFNNPENFKSHGKYQKNFNPMDEVPAGTPDFSKWR